MLLRQLPVGSTHSLATAHLLAGHRDARRVRLQHGPERGYWQTYTDPQSGTPFNVCEGHYSDETMSLQ